jgi:hypothetical protein
MKINYANENMSWGCENEWEIFCVCINQHFEHGTDAYINDVGIYLWCFYLSYCKMLSENA